jgi:hypothetical protein
VSVIVADMVSGRTNDVLGAICLSVPAVVSGVGAV